MARFRCFSLLPFPSMVHLLQLCSLGADPPKLFPIWKEQNPETMHYFHMYIFCNRPSQRFLPLYIPINKNVHKHVFSL